MKDKWNALTKNPRWWAVSLFSLLLLSSVVVAAVHLSAYFRESETVTFSGRHHLDFRVFYLENNFFEDNPVPRNLDFLMSYTDFIEIESMFVVSSSYETDINYSRHAEKRLIIRHLGSVAGSFVFEQIIQMTPTIGATFTIFPKDYINIYFEFVEDQIRQMYAENVVAQGIRGFSAELQVNFTYSVNVPEFGLNETITHGYRFPLTSEIFTFTSTGTSTFNRQIDLTANNTEITISAVILFTVLFATSLFGILYNIKILTVNPDEYQQNVNDIMKKYSNEIVVYNKSADLSKHEPRVVKEFKELLKLAVNLNKHIMCYRTDAYIEFAVIVDGYACMYILTRDKNKSDPAPHPEQDEELQHVSNVMQADRE